MIMASDFANPRLVGEPPPLTSPSTTKTTWSACWTNCGRWARGNRPTRWPTDCLGRECLNYSASKETARTGSGSVGRPTAPRPRHGARKTWTYGSFRLLGQTVGADRLGELSAVNHQIGAPRAWARYGGHRRRTGSLMPLAVRLLLKSYGRSPRISASMPSSRSDLERTVSMVPSASSVATASTSLLTWRSWAISAS